MASQTPPSRILFVATLFGTLLHLAIRVVYLPLVTSEGCSSLECFQTNRARKWSLVYLLVVGEVAWVVELHSTCRAFVDVVLIHMVVQVARLVKCLVTYLARDGPPFLLGC